MSDIYREFATDQDILNYTQTYMTAADYEVSIGLREVK
jgi:hypothetical protein